MLDQQQIDLYWSRGWVVAEAVFGPEETEEIAQLALQVASQELREDTGVSDEFARTNPEAAYASYAADHSEDGRVAPRKIDTPFLKREEFQRFVLDERLTGILRAVLGKEPLLLEDQILMKPPEFGSAKPYHQDNAYFLCRPADDVLTAWIALDDVDEANGCLRYIDGSHSQGILPHEPLPDAPYNKSPASELIDMGRESVAPVKKGGVVLHHCQTLHTSHRNHSKRWRRGYATHWGTADVSAKSSFLDNPVFQAVLARTR